MKDFTWIFIFCLVILFIGGVYIGRLREIWKRDGPQPDEADSDDFSYDFDAAIEAIRPRFASPSKPAVPTKQDKARADRSIGL